MPKRLKSSSFLAAVSVPCGQWQTEDDRWGSLSLLPASCRRGFEFGTCYRISLDRHYREISRMFTRKVNRWRCREKCLRLDRTVNVRHIYPYIWLNSFQNIQPFKGGVDPWTYGVYIKFNQTSNMDLADPTNVAKSFICAHLWESMCAGHLVAGLHIHMWLLSLSLLDNEIMKKWTHPTLLSVQNVEIDKDRGFEKLSFLPHPSNFFVRDALSWFLKKWRNVRLRSTILHKMCG